MIAELTEEQKEKLSEYRDKWMAIGLSTEPANRSEAEKGVDEMYRIAGLQSPKKIWCMSPLSSGLTRYCIMNIKEINLGEKIRVSVRDSVWASVRDSVRASVGASVRDSVGASVRASVGASVWASVGASVWASVWDSVWDSVGDSVWDSVGDSVWDSVWDSVGDSVGDSVRASVGASVRASVGASVRASVGASVRDSGYGQHDANWLGFYDYFNNELKLKKQTCRLNGLWIYSRNAGWMIPHKNICFLSERHNVCKLKDGVIHCDGGPAIQYPDGFSIWGLNGVRVPQYLSETPESKLDIEFFKKESNADVKAEFIRKYGIDRMSGIGKVKDTWKNYKTQEWWVKSEYELIDMSPIFQSVNYAPHLKMKNQTTGTYHLEGVGPECQTIEDAINYRWNKRGVKQFQTEEIR